ncbi:MAG: hypothetical protein K8F91_25415, partial [Candidatus Obscuribacterales bacterium]|nr:hypothetical protein [Candidatus Obscuribacterales bacterium]
MAIQLNDRDNLIFELIEEHEVLLEKHISWFIAEENKPVLIRDRLRKLFYLDYLLCHRHGTKLPWWTTPTKPLVYLLSPMAKSVSGIAQDDVDRFDAEWQRHHLEVANLRMLYLIGQTDGQISNFQWTTAKGETKESFGLDAKVTFTANGIAYDIGIVNQPGVDEQSIQAMEEALEHAGVEMIFCVSRDQESAVAIQKAIHEKGSSKLARYCFFATHQDLYKKGMVSSKWQNVEQKPVNLFTAGEKSGKESTVWTT